MAELIQTSCFVTPSEREAASTLRGLPASWLVICNKELVSPSGFVYELDFIIVGDHLVFVVDEKSWKGVIRGNENIWVLPSGESRPSPLAKLGHASRQLAGMLRGRIPHLHDLPKNQHFVRSVVILSHPEARLDVHDPRVGQSVFPLSGAVEELTRWDAAEKTVSLAPAKQRIRDELVGFRSRPKFPTEINAYQILEVLQCGRGYRAFRARHRGGVERIIKLYELDPVDQPREFINREYYAVQAAALKGLAAGVDPYFFWGDDRFLVVPFHLPEGKPLRAQLPDGALNSPQYALTAARACFAALQMLHTLRMIHRALGPDRVHLIESDAGLRVTFSDFLFCRVDQRQTVSAELDELEKDDVYLSPECRIGFALAEPASDVYSMALALVAHVSGAQPALEDVESGDISGWAEQNLQPVLRSWPGEISRQFCGLLTACARGEPRERPTVGQVLAEVDRLVEMAKQETATQGDHVPATLGSGQYKVIRKLGEGASSVTYLAEDQDYGGYYALKKIKNPEAVRRLAGGEFRLLKDLQHPNLRRIYDIRKPDDDFHLKMEYIPGSTLENYRDRFLFRRDALYELGQAIIGALSYLHDQGLLHRDISPRNIIVPDENEGKFCLIDFGLAAAADESRTTAVGTPLYRAPEIPTSGWSPAADVYALAVVLYEALTGMLPFECRDGIPKKERLIPPPAEMEEGLPRPLLKCLRKGAAPSPSDRYTDGGKFLEAFLKAFTAEPVAEAGVEGEQVSLAWVRDISGLYRDSIVGNANNRGLDTEFARRTYVNTRLDEQLLPEILEARKHLVFLTGNPGDGKTAFLVKVREAVASLSATEMAADAHGWRCVKSGRSYVALYDASESQGEVSADMALDHVLTPFAGPAEPDLDRAPVALVAVNDGRLLGFFERHREKYAWLAEQVDGQFFGEAAGNAGIAVVDLKRRALAGLPGEVGTVFQSMLRVLIDPAQWQECDGCAARNDCPIKFNAESLRNDNIASCLESLFLVQHWRRERRATIRDVRSALSWCLAANRTCEMIHACREAGEPVDWTSALYFNAVFEGASGNDEMLTELALLDPAQRVHPRLERFLNFCRITQDYERLERRCLRLPGRALLQRRVAAERWLNSMKRRLYFEGLASTDAEDLWDLPFGEQVLPYWYLADFRRALAGELEEPQVRGRLLRGISQSERVPPQATGEGLAVALNQNRDEEITVIKHFGADQFRCQVRFHSGIAVEVVPDRLELFHVSGHPTLAIGLDMFELLSRLADGYLPDAREFEPFLMDLQEFKAALVRYETQEVLLLDGRSRIHRVAAESGVVRWKEEHGVLG